MKEITKRWNATTPRFFKKLINIGIGIGIIGLGFVGGSIYTSFKIKGINVVGYDIIKEYDKFEDCLLSDILFLCLPTQFDENTKCYDKSIIM